MTQTATQTAIQAGGLRLIRTDAARNMARFYRLHLQPTLFGQVALCRHWGRIGHAGQSRAETFADACAAEAACARLERAKRRRGYAEAGPTANAQ